MRKPLFALWIIALTPFAASVSASDTWGPAIGQEVPHSLQARDQANTTRDFEALVGDKGLAIFFVRSADWCPFCQRQLIEINKRLGDFHALDINVVAISYDDVDILSDFSAEWTIDYPLLSDEGSRIIRAFGILNEREKPGTTGYGIPHPGIVITNADGVVVATFAEKSYRKRPKLDDVLEQARTALN